MNVTTDLELSPGMGDLVRYMDGELPANERERVARALAADTALARAFARLQGASTELRTLLGDEPDPTPVAPPDFGSLRRHRRHRFLAAAIAILVGAGLVGVSPAGASLARGVQAVVAWIAGDAGSAAPPSGEARSTSGAATVAVRAAGSVFVIRLEGSLPPGRLMVERAEGGDRIRATAGEGVELLFLRGELVVRSTGAAPDGVAPEALPLLTVRVPPGVDRIRVARPDGQVEEVTVSGDAAAIVDLAPNGGS